MRRIFTKKLKKVFAILFVAMQIFAINTYSQNSEVTTSENGNPALENELPPIEWLGIPPESEEANVKKSLRVVIVEVEINEKGIVTNAKIISSPNEKLSAAVIKFAKTLKFKPALKNGKPIDPIFELPIYFKNE